MRLKDIIPDLINVPEELSDAHPTRIASRLEDAEAGCLYFHLKGVYKDKNAYLDEIAKKKPLLIVLDEDVIFENTDIPSVRVKNARAELARSYARYAGVNTDATVFIGVTGTNGKTTTATMIENILTESGERVGFIGTGSIRSVGRELSDTYYSMTTPDPNTLYPAIAKMQSDGCKYIVMEVSSHAIALKKIAPIKFKIGIFTNLSHEHMDFHADIEEYYNTKMNLFDSCETAIFNKDDPFSRRGYTQYRGNKIGVGALFDADISAFKPHSLGMAGSQFLVRGPGYIFRMKLPLTGMYNVYNALCAIAAAVSLGIPPKTCKSALTKMKAPRGRFETYLSDVTVILDYAHTPSALENVLKTVNSLKEVGQNVITVIGCGGNRDKSKRPLMGAVAEKHSDTVILTEDNSRDEPTEEILRDITSGFEDPARAVVIPSRTDAIEAAILTAVEGSIILIVGKGAECYNVDKDGYHPFDERVIVNVALEKRNGCNAGKA